MSTLQKPTSLPVLIGGTVALLEGWHILTTTPPETVALAFVACLLLRDHANRHQ